MLAFRTHCLHQFTCTLPPRRYGAGDLAGVNINQRKVGKIITTAIKDQQKVVNPKPNRSVSSLPPTYFGDLRNNLGHVGNMKNLNIEVLRWLEKSYCQELIIYHGYIEKCYEIPRILVEIV